MRRALEKRDNSSTEFQQGWSKCFPWFTKREFMTVWFLFVTYFHNIKKTDLSMTIVRNRNQSVINSRFVYQGKHFDQPCWNSVEELSRFIKSRSHVSNSQILVKYLKALRSGEPSFYLIVSTRLELNIWRNTEIFFPGFCVRKKHNCFFLHFSVKVKRQMQHEHPYI